MLHIFHTDSFVLQVENVYDLCCDRFRKFEIKSCWSVTSTSARTLGKRTMARRMSGYCSTAHCLSILLYIKVLTRGMPTSVACLVLVSLFLFLLSVMLTPRWWHVVLLLCFK